MVVKTINDLKKPETKITPFLHLDPRNSREDARTLVAYIPRILSILQQQGHNIEDGSIIEKLKVKEEIENKRKIEEWEDAVKKRFPRAFRGCETARTERGGGAIMWICPNAPHARVNTAFRNDRMYSHLEIYCAQPQAKEAIAVASQ